MATKKTIAVVGATGAQGGALARAILHDPDNPFHVRALTRNARSDKGTELARLGACFGFGQDAPLVLGGKTPAQSTIVFGTGHHFRGALK